MSPPRWPAVWMLGAGQCVFWGILYYAYSVLLVPMRDSLDATQAAVAGAYSVGLGVSALLAPRVGRAFDRGGGTRLFRAGALAGALLLVAWSFVRQLWALYAVWLGLGACMALVLYETAFALVTRALADPTARLRALASVTVMGGLASTVFLPIVGAGVAHLDWRWTLRGLAVVWLATTAALEVWVLPAFRAADAASNAAPTTAPNRLPDPALLLRVAAPFVSATFTAMALTTLLVPHLVDAGHPIETASLVLAALGVMQLPGRVWLWRGGSTSLSMRQLLVAPLLLQAAGLALLAAVHDVGRAALGVAVFGIGAGLHTLARPWVVPQLFGVAAAGRVNGRIAGAQGAARAAGPFAAATAAAHWGTPVVFALLAGALAACAPLAWSVARRLSAAPADI